MIEHIMFGVSRSARLRIVHNCRIAFFALPLNAPHRDINHRDCVKSKREILKTWKVLKGL
jgi:hypothetical protein